MLNLINLEKAISALQDAFLIYEECPLREDAREKIAFRDCAIQRFEFTFELSWKTLKHYLQQYGAEQVETLNMRDLFRVGFEQGLIEDPVRWFHYLRMRNQTSHTYDDAKAHEVFCAAREYVPDAVSLLKRMKEKAQ